MAFRLLQSKCTGAYHNSVNVSLTSNASCDGKVPVPCPGSFPYNYHGQSSNHQSRQNTLSHPFGCVTTRYKFQVICWTTSSWNLWYIYLLITLTRQSSRTTEELREHSKRRVLLSFGVHEDRVMCYHKLKEYIYPTRRLYISIPKYFSFTRIHIYVYIFYSSHLPTVTHVNI